MDNVLCSREINRQEYQTVEISRGHCASDKSGLCRGRKTPLQIRRQRSGPQTLDRPDSGGGSFPFKRFEKQITFLVVRGLRKFPLMLLGHTRCSTLLSKRVFSFALLIRE